MIDWSAAAKRGPKTPKKDQCWMAWGTQRDRPDPDYFRTRVQVVDCIRGLVRASTGNVLVCFDFPYGFPHNSGLGGGRNAAKRLAKMIADGPDNANNRFEAAANLNAELNSGLPGPFWGCPVRWHRPTLQPTKPKLDEKRFSEFRIVENRAQKIRPGIQSVWKLSYRGCVGSQTLLGLPAIHRLLNDPALAGRSTLWPFETDWDERLLGIVHAEIWPSLFVREIEKVRIRDQRKAGIRDARQVAAARDWALDADATGTLREFFTRPPGLSAREERICSESEGWILGVR
jgi:hypothetical protein